MGSQTVNTGASTSETNYPCLHLGPGGKRCTRSAIRDGFCRFHHPELAESIWVDWLRKGAAAVLLLIVLWPVVSDLVHALVRWFR